MGGDHSRDSDKQKYKQAAALPEPLNLKRYGKIAVIGRGGFGRVWKIESKKERRLYALKEMSKASAVQEERGVSHERTQPAEVPQGRLPHQRPLRLPGPRQPLPHHGPGQRGGPALPPHQEHPLQRAPDQVLRLLHPAGPRVHAQPRHPAPRPEAREHRVRPEGLPETDRHGRRPHLEARKFERHLGHARLHGARSHVPLQPRSRRRLLRAGHHHLRVHLRVQTLRGRQPPGNTRQDIGQAGADQEEGHPARLVPGSSGLREPTHPAQTPEQTGQQRPRGSYGPPLVQRRRLGKDTPQTSPCPLHARLQRRRVPRPTQRHPRSPHPLRNHPPAQEGSHPKPLPGVLLRRQASGQPPAGDLSPQTRRSYNKVRQQLQVNQYQGRVRSSACLNLAQQFSNSFIFCRELVLSMAGSFSLSNRPSSGRLRPLEMLSVLNSRVGCLRWSCSISLSLSLRVRISLFFSLMVPRMTERMASSLVLGSTTHILS